MNNQPPKTKRGRPAGKKINWSLIKGIEWPNKTDAEIAHKLGTSAVNVYLKRKSMIAAGKKVECRKKKYTRFTPPAVTTPAPVPAT